MPGECDFAMPGYSSQYGSIRDWISDGIEINGIVYDIVPGANDFCELAASYTDEVFDICGGGLEDTPYLECL